MNLQGLVGEKVQHTAYGYGTIISTSQSANNDHIHVSFDDREDTKTFQFPQGFTKYKVLSSNSTVVKDMISQIAICDECGEPCEKLTTVGGEKLCQNCLSTLTIKCYDCGKRMYSSEAVALQIFLRGELFFCKDCSKNYSICKECGITYSIRQSMEEYPNIPIDEGLCPHCLDHIAISCPICQQSFLEDKIVYVDGHRVCLDCAKEFSAPCAKCGKTTLVRDDNKPAVCYDCVQKEKRLIAEKEYKDYVIKKLDSVCYTKRISWYGFKRSESTPIMTELRRENGILILRVDFRRVQDVIIVYDLPEKYRNYYRGYYTATSLKKTYVMYFADEAKEHEKDTILCLNMDEEEVKIWREPIRLAAVTDDDKDFCKIWVGEDLAYEGNEYGDTSDFYIIGTMYHSL